MSVIIHHEIDKLLLVHSSQIPDLFGRWTDIHAFIDEMAARGFHAPNGAVTKKHVLLTDRDCTIGIKNDWGRTSTTARIRTEALHFRFGEAYERIWQVVRSLPWVEGDVHLGDIHLCADVMGIRIEDEQFVRFDDRMQCVVESERTEKTIRGKIAVGGVTYRWMRNGEVRVLCYDKVAELRRHRKKGLFMRPLYERKGWDRVAPITRIEVRPTREQIRAHYNDAGELDLTALWRACLRELRYTDGGTSADPSASPTASWWDDLLALDFSLRGINLPLPPEIRRHTRERALAQANGSAVGGFAKKLVLHLDGEVLPEIDPEDAERIVEAALTVDPFFAQRVALKATEQGMTRLAVERAPWPPSFARDVLRYYDARCRSSLS